MCCAVANMQPNHWVPYSLGNFSTAVELVASQEGLYCSELIL